MNTLPQAKWDLAVWLLAQGETQREVARLAGVNRETVMLLARESGEQRSRSAGMRRYHQRRREQRTSTETKSSV
jgi:hypothetical protein